MDFQKEFERVQKVITEVKLAQIARRSMAIQSKSKIKPSALNPVLLNTKSLRGY